MKLWSFNKLILKKSKTAEKIWNTNEANFNHRDINWSVELLEMIEYGTKRLEDKQTKKNRQTVAKAKSNNLYKSSCKTKSNWNRW